MANPEPIKRKDDPRILEMRKALYKKIRATCKKEKMPVSVLAYLIRANANLGGILKNNKDMSIYTVINAMSVLGYELSFTRNEDEFNWKKDKILNQRYEKFKYNQRAAKRKPRGLPAEDYIRVRTKGKRAYDGKIVIISRRSIQAVQKQKDDLFGTPGSSNALQGGDMERGD